MNVSKYRHITGKIDKRENWYPDISTSQSSAASTFIRASANFVAVNWQSGTGALGVIPLASVGKRKGEVYMVHAHSGQIADFDFSPFDDSLLATSSDDATIKLWSLPENASGAKLTEATATMSGHQKVVETIQFHPTAVGVLASGSGDKTVKVWDLETASEKYSVGCFDNGVTGIAWNYDGSLLAAVSKDLKNRVFDPRVGEPVAVGEGHQGIKAARVVWLGNSAYFVTAGFAKSRERQLSMWDSRDLSKVIKTITLDSSTGIISPVYDVDAQLLFISGSGDSTIRTFDMNTQFTTEPAFQELSAAPSDTPAKGICAVPKRALDVMEVEIDRLLKVTANNVIPVVYSMARKSKSQFADDVFPISATTTPALQAAEYYAGENKVPVLATLDPAYRPKPKQSSSSSSGSEESKSVFSSCFSSNNTDETEVANDSPVAESTTPPSGQSTPPLGRREPDVQRTGIIPKIVRTSKYRHIAGVSMPKTSHYTNLKVFGNTSNTCIAANSEYVAVPWVGTGGPLAVIPISQVGRQITVPCIEIGNQLLDFDLSQFNPSLIVTGAEDSHIKIWKVPEGGLPKTNKILNYTNFEADLIGHNRKIVSVNFHPTAENVVISTGGDMAVKLWDIEQQKERLSINNMHTDMITSVSVSSKGDLFLTGCKDKMMRVIDPRSNQLVSEVASHSGVKGSKALWLGDTNNIFSVGHNKTSEREYSLWDARNLAAGPTTTKGLDQLAGIITPYYDEDTGVVYMAGKGDGTIRMVEINDQEPFVHFLTEYASGTPQMGIAPVSKHLLNVKKCEIARFFKVSDTTVEPLQFTVPRNRLEFFQDDIYTPTRVNTPTMTAEQWFGGASEEPQRVSLCPSDMTPLSTAPAVVKKDLSSKFAEVVVDDTPSRNQVINMFLDRVVSQRDVEEPTKKQEDESPCVSDSEWD
ncbi:hypothetical protein SAMD00019534_071490 [Acytostelium subglobosum LB1]|uniref:hypothetical protein n=1 Tax=Acytostelium subglobosum LB1 TaxID=1410327 RepID=UPI0006450E52|nr:hypothetical protein SAMD00019534_071490 [Acytostelium subglobosum LB1]GAM23974.1 hypothetical protein SAMD00019534_071490 [Acytostelium subglobosum LB1]|eukprot:XP_012753010.1 hypothetical protein SAMD00019534_071490 [Acytostelium subglobosum LB1]